MTNSLSLWLVPLSQQTMNGPRLVTFAHAGAGAFTFRPWSAFLPSHWSLLGVQLPGRETRGDEPFANDLVSCGQAVAQALSQLPPQTTLFYGHSMGAMVAFEAYRALRQMGGPLPVHFVAGARRAPHIPEPAPCHLVDDEALMEVVFRLGAAQSRLLSDPRLRAYFLPVIRADFALFEGYVYQDGPALHCPITVFAGSNDQEAATWELLAWQRHTRTDLNFHSYEAGHFFHQTLAAQLCSDVCYLVDKYEKGA